MSDDWVSEEAWKAAPEPAITDTPDCAHEHPHMSVVWVDGAAIAAIRCSTCGTILGTGSDG